MYRHTGRARAAIACALVGIALMPTSTFANASAADFALTISGSARVSITPIKHGLALDESRVELVKGHYVAVTTKDGGLAEVVVANGEPELTLPLGGTDPTLNLPRAHKTVVSIVTDGVTRLWLPAGTIARLTRLGPARGASLQEQAMSPASTSPVAIGYAPTTVDHAAMSVTAAVLEWQAPPVASERQADACFNASNIARCDANAGNGSFAVDDQYISSTGSFGMDRFVAGHVYNGKHTEAYLIGQAVALSAPPFTAATLVAFGVG